MPGVLFQFPKTIGWDNGTAQAGSTLTFSQTGTATPQNVYTDIELSVAHSNPVTADAEGVFEPIFLDPALPDYRVVFKDTAGATVYTVDDVPAGTEKAQDFTLEGAAPYLLLTETDGSANNKNYRLIASGEQLLVQLGNDALDTWQTVIAIDRTANTVDSVNIPTGLQFNGVEVATVATGSFTGEVTGLAGTVTGTVTYRITGGIVVLTIDTAITGTSDTTAMTLTGLPAAIRTLDEFRAVTTWVQDNGVLVSALCSVRNDGVVVFGMGAGFSVTGFTASGAKGLPETWCLVYGR